QRTCYFINRSTGFLKTGINCIIAYSHEPYNIRNYNDKKSSGKQKPHIGSCYRIYNFVQFNHWNHNSYSDNGTGNGITYGGSTGNVTGPFQRTDPDSVQQYNR